MNIYDRLIIPEHDRNTSITRSEAEFIMSFLEEHNIKGTLEIGLAYGCSAAHILSATRSTHVVIDPFQSRDYHDLGLLNIIRLGLGSYLEFIPEHSHSALPRLLREGRRFNFVFIDGGHRFDEILIDFYFSDLLMAPGGHICFHDAWMQATHTVVSFIRTNREDYLYISVPCDNLILVRKINSDVRPWNHFKDFCSLDRA